MKPKYLQLFGIFYGIVGINSNKAVPTSCLQPITAKLHGKAYITKMKKFIDARRCMHEATPMDLPMGIAL